MVETGTGNLGAGAGLPDLTLPSTDGTDVNLGTLAGITVVYVYPRTGAPNEPPLEGWDQIPGAIGCTPQSCGFRDRHTELLAAGADRIFGLSTQKTNYQQEVVGRLQLPFALLSDADLKLAQAIGLATFNAAGMTLLTRVTLVIRDGQTDRVFSPITNPAENANQVLAFLTPA